VIGKLTISDWYADAEGRDSEAPGYDWENDDRPDRTPDSWLDRLGSKTAAVPQQSRSVGRRTAPQRAPSPARSSTARSSSPSIREIANAARPIRAAQPNLSDKALAKRLRQQRGWTAVTQADVRKALGNDTSGPTRDVRATSSGHGRQPVGKRTSGSSPSRPVSDPPLRKVADAVRTLRLAEPAASTETLTQLLRQRGWTAVTQADVLKALGSMAPQPRSGRPQTPATTKSRPKQANQPPPGPSPASRSIANPSLQAIARAARALLAAQPGLGYKTLARRLQEDGWTMVTQAHVRKALGGTTPQPRKPRPPTPSAAKTRHKQADREATRFIEKLARRTPMPRASVCPSCGTPVSVLGRCRCS
jgi:hypothetical protein